MRQPMEEGDRKAWQHALANDLGQLLSDDEIRRLTVLLLYTRESKDGDTGGVPEADVTALLEWATDVRMSSGLLDALLAGNLYVRMRVGDKEPTFALTPRGEAAAREAAERAGLPVPDADEP